MEQVEGSKNFCGIDYRFATRILGWIQIISNGILFLPAFAITVALLTFNEADIRKKVSIFQKTSLTEVTYDHVLFYSLMLTINTFFGTGSGFFLVKAVKEHRPAMIVMWSYYIFLTWFSNSIFLTSESYLLSGLFSVFFVALSTFPCLIVSSFYTELVFGYDYEYGFQEDIDCSCDRSDKLQYKKKNDVVPR